MNTTKETIQALRDLENMATLAVITKKLDPDFTKDLAPMAVAALVTSGLEVICRISTVLSIELCDDMQDICIEGQHSNEPRLNDEGREDLRRMAELFQHYKTFQRACQPLVEEIAQKAVSHG